MDTSVPSKEEAREERKWHLIDADGLVLGRLASEVAALLRGKHKANFAPHVDCGDGVVVINAEKIVLTGAKLENKFYHDHTGHIGNVVSRSAGELLRTDAPELIKRAVRGMLPKGVLGQHMRQKLKVYTGSAHENSAQKPVKYELKYTKAVHAE